MHVQRRVWRLQLREPAAAAAATTTTSTTSVCL
jgi:hypothetical protein